MLTMDAHTRQRGKTVKRFVKNFLQIRNSREFFVFLFFLIVSFCYWYMITIPNEYETKFNIRLRLIGLPDNLMIIEPLPEEIVVTLKDKGEQIVRYKTQDKLDYIDIDFRSYPNTAGHTAIYGNELKKLISTHLQSSTQIISISEDTLQYHIAAKAGKKLPVRLYGTIGAASQYVVNSITIEPDSVIAYAIPSILDTLQAAYTEHISQTALTDSLHMQLPIKKQARNIHYAPESVMLEVSVSPYVTKSVEVPIEGYLFPYGIRLKTFPSKVKVLFKVSLQDFHQVTAADFSIQVPYSKVKNNLTGKIRPNIGKAPEGVKDITIEPSETDYLIELYATPQ